MANEVDRVLDDVGPRLRALRKQRGLTLEQLAMTTGLGLSTLSRLESGQRRPSLEVLLRLAQEYRVPIDELVGAPPVGDPRIHPRPIKRNGSTWIPLTRNPGGVNAYKAILPPIRPGRRCAEPGVHEGYEWLYVLAGQLRLRLGDEEFQLLTGEAAEFDTRVPHQMTSGGDQPVELLIIFDHSGDRVHVAAVAPA